MNIWMLCLFLLSSLVFAGPEKENIGLSLMLFHQRGPYYSDRREVMKIAGELIHEGKDYYLVSKPIDLKLKLSSFKKGSVGTGFFVFSEHLSFKLSPQDFKVIISAMLGQSGSLISEDIRSMLSDCFNPSLGNEGAKRHKCIVDSGGSARFKMISPKFLDPEKCESYTMNFVNDESGLSDLIMIADSRSNLSMLHDLEETSFSLKIVLDKPKSTDQKLIPKSFR